MKREITEIAVTKTMEPMQTVLDCLFEKKCEIYISMEVLELIKQAHSYTKFPGKKGEVYKFYKRVRGTNALFSFSVNTGEKENLVSGLDYVTELGLVQRNEEMFHNMSSEKVYIMLQEL